MVEIRRADETCRQFRPFAAGLGPRGDLDSALQSLILRSLMSGDAGTRSDEMPPGRVEDCSMNASVQHALRNAAIDAIAVAIWATAATLSAAEPPDAQGAAKNLARGAKYVMSPPPSYSHCTDPGDATQLTDGQLTEGYFWTQEGTVGWSHAD